MKNLGLFTLALIFCFTSLYASEVNVYSGRKAKLIKPLFDKFENQTGIKVNLVTAKSDALLKRIEAEGASSPADIFITVGIIMLLAKELFINGKK